MKLSVQELIVVVVLVSFGVRIGTPIVHLIVFVLRVIAFVLRFVASLQLLRLDRRSNWEPVSSADLAEQIEACSCPKPRCPHISVTPVRRIAVVEIETAEVERLTLGLPDSGSVPIGTREESLLANGHRVHQ